MTFIYSTERRNFEKNWAQTEALYRKHGMSEEAIREMREYDWSEFKARRIEALHTQELEVQLYEDNDIMESPLMMKFFDQLTTPYDACGNHSRYWWLEELSDLRLVAVIPKFTEEEKELLTLIVVEEYTQQECAVILHKSKSAISRKWLSVLAKIAEK